MRNLLSMLHTTPDTSLELNTANVWCTLNKIKQIAFNENFNQSGTTIYISKQDTSRRIRDKEIIVKSNITG